MDKVLAPPGNLPDQSADHERAIHWAAYQLKPKVIFAYQVTRAILEAHLFDGAPLPDGIRSSSSSCHPCRREIYHCRLALKREGEFVIVTEGDWVVARKDGGFDRIADEDFTQTYVLCGAHLPSVAAQTDGLTREESL